MDLPPRSYSAIIRPHKNSEARQSPLPLKEHARSLSISDDSDEDIDLTPNASPRERPSTKKSSTKQATLKAPSRVSHLGMGGLGKPATQPRPTHFQFSSPAQTRTSLNLHSPIIHPTNLPQQPGRSSIRQSKVHANIQAIDENKFYEKALEMLPNDSRVEQAMSALSLQDPVIASASASQSQSQSQPASASASAHMSTSSVSGSASSSSASASMEKDPREGRPERPEELKRGSIRLGHSNIPTNHILGSYLKAVPLLAKLTDAERAQLGGALTIENYRDGEMVVEQGSIGKGFYIIKTGRARVRRKAPEGEEVELDLIKDGDYFGEAALLTNNARGASVLADGDLTVFFLDRKHFVSLFQLGRLKDVQFAKRKGVSEGTGDEDLTLTKQPLYAFRDKTEKEKRLIYDTVKSNVLFQGMAYYGVLKVISKMWKISIPKNTRLIKQGEMGDNFYVVQKGKFHVFIQSADGSNMRKVDSIGKRQAFGELALMYNTPRNATIISTQACVVWAVDRFTFRRVLRNVSSKKLKEYEQFLAGVPLLSPLSATERAKIAEALEEQKFNPGDVIVKQSTVHEEVNASMYIISSGRVRVDRTQNSKTYEVTQLKRADYFGERALLKNEPRSATITALTSVQVLKLDRHAFSLLLGPLEDILAQRVQGYEVQDQQGPVERLERKQSEMVDGHPGGANGGTPLNTSNNRKLTAPLAETRKKPPMGDLIVLGTLGKGSYGKVQLVKDNITGETYAMKTVSKSRIRKTKHQDHILNEKRLLEQLDHPFLINLHGTYKDANFLYYLLEPALGGELFTILRSHTFFDNSTARFFAACVLLALEHMHDRNIIFRDLKPENVLLDGQGFCKVADFGFAKQLDEQGRTYTLCGTPAYLAPEIIAGKAHGKAVDWWCMGVFIYELLAGYTPFRDKSENMMKLYERITAGLYKTPPHFSPEAEDLISRLMVNKPTQRLGVIAGGTESIKRHPWFVGLDFNALFNRTLRPPIIPFIQDNTDMHNFAWFDEEGVGTVPTSCAIETGSDPNAWDDEF